MTGEQEALWRKMGMSGPYRDTLDQTRDQQVEQAISSYRYACTLEGISVPSETEIRDRIGVDASQ